MKKTAIFLAMLIIFSCTAFCQENGLSINVSCETYADSATGELRQTLTVSGEAPAELKGKNIGLLVLRPDVTPDDAQDPMKYFAAAYQSEINSDLSYNFSFDFDDNSGNYTFLVFADTMNNSVSTVFNVPSVSDLGDFLDSCDARSISASEMASEIAGKSAELTIDATVFNQLSLAVQQKICADILATPGQIDITNFFELFKKCTILTGVAQSEGAKIKIITDYYENELKLKEKDIYQAFSTLKDKDTVYKFMEVPESFSTYDEIAKCFYESAFLGILRESLSYQNILPLTKQYAASLGNPSYIAEVEARPLKQTEILNSVGAGLVNIDTFKKLEDAFAIAIAQADIPPADNGGGSFGGGGSGGGGGGTSHKVTPEESGKEEEKIPEPSVKITFDDLDKAEWAKEAILALNSKGIVSGDGKGKFHPMNNITRAEFVKIITEAFSVSDDYEGADIRFGDVTENDWYYPYVCAATNHGLVNGKSETVFGAKDYITRQDMAVLIYRALTKFKQINPVETVTKKFSDYQDISDYARNSILMLSEYKIINGFSDGSVKPHGNATRAEATQLIYNVLDYAGNL